MYFKRCANDIHKLAGQKSPLSLLPFHLSFCQAVNAVTQFWTGVARLRFVGLGSGLLSEPFGGGFSGRLQFSQPLL